MNRPQKVIFDMDGLIFDSERIFMRELGEAMKGYGYEMRREDYIKTLGLTGKALSDMTRGIYGEDYPHEKLSRMAREKVDEIALNGEMPVKQGITKLLEFLKANNIPCAVASSTHTRYVKKYLDIAGLLKYFDAVIGGDMVSRSKPEPDIFLAALDKTLPQNALVLEDSENGIIAASRAGIPVICIPDMAFPRDEIRSLALAVAESAQDVILMLEEKI